MYIYKKNFMAPFYGRVSTASMLQSNFGEAVYFLPLSSQKFLVLILLTSEGWKAESTLEPRIGLELGTPGLESSILITRPLIHKTSHKKSPQNVHEMLTKVLFDRQLHFNKKC